MGQRKSLFMIRAGVPLVRHIGERITGAGGRGLVCGAQEEYEDNNKKNRERLQSTGIRGRMQHFNKQAVLTATPP